MKARYFADDGKEFLTEEECLAYERDITIDDYVKGFQCGELKDRANRMIEWFENACDARRMSDDSLEREGRETRYGGAVFCGDYSRGIMYLRDDAVDILIERIRELEEENARHRDEVQKMMRGEDIAPKSVRGRAGSVRCGTRSRG